MLWATAQPVDLYGFVKLPIVYSCDFLLLVNWRASGHLFVLAFRGGLKISLKSEIFTAWCKFQTILPDKLVAEERPTGKRLKTRNCLEFCSKLTLFPHLHRSFNGLRLHPVQELLPLILWLASTIRTENFCVALLSAPAETVSLVGSIVA
jgi:hypothetical protein